jgi:hypothetical protein
MAMMAPASPVQIKIMKIIYVYFPLFIDLLKKKNIHNKINEIQYSNLFAFFYNVKSIPIYKQEMTKTCFKPGLFVIAKCSVKIVFEIILQ